MTTPTSPTPSDLPHRPADDTEQVYFDGPPSAVASLGHFLLFTLVGLLVIATPFLIHFTNHAVPGWSYPVAILIGLLIVAIPWIRLRSHRYRISNYRIDFERGLLWKRIDTLELWHVEDLSFSQGPFDRLMGVGTITVVSHDMTTPRLTLAGLPNARPTFDSLKQRIIAVKRQRGVIKMDTGG